MIDLVERITDGVWGMLVWYYRDTLIEILLNHRLGLGILVFLPIYLFIPVAFVARLVAPPVAWIVDLIRDRRAHPR